MGLYFAFYFCEFLGKEVLLFLEEWRFYGVWNFGLFADVLEGGEDALAQIEEGAQLGDFGGRVDVVDEVATGLSEALQEAGVNLVGLGLDAFRLNEASDPQRVDKFGANAMGREGLQEHLLVTTSSLADDAWVVELLAKGDKLTNAVEGVGENAFAGGGGKEIAFTLGDCTR